MEKNDKLLMATRAALLAIVDAIEDYLEMPRTKDLRKQVKRMEIADNENVAGAIA